MPWSPSQHSRIAYLKGRAEGTPGAKLGPRFENYAGGEIGLILSDVDGTLVPDAVRGELSRRQRAAMYLGFEAELLMGLNSARGKIKTEHLIGAMLRLAKAAGDPELARYHGLNNGASVFDAKKGEIVHQRAIPLNAADEIVRELQGWEGVNHWVNDGGIDFAPTPGVSATKESLGAYGRPHNPWLPFSPDNVTNLEVNKEYNPHAPLVIVAEQLTNEQLKKLEALAGAYDGVAVQLYKTTGEGGKQRSKVFVLNEEATKVHATRVIADLTKTKMENVSVIGDSGNDGPVVDYVTSKGGLGVAMGNGVESTKARAALIAPSQSRGGVAWLIEAATKTRHRES